MFFQGACTLSYGVYHITCRVVHTTLCNLKTGLIRSPLCCPHSETVDIWRAFRNWSCYFTITYTPSNFWMYRWPGFIAVFTGCSCTTFTDISFDMTIHCSGTIRFCCTFVILIIPAFEYTMYHKHILLDDKAYVHVEKLAISRSTSFLI